MDSPFQIFRASLSALGIVLMALGLSACLPIPFPAEVPDPEPFSHDALDFVVPGVTTREEIYVAFKNWEWHTEGETRVLRMEPVSIGSGRWWSYKLVRGMFEWCIGPGGCGGREARQYFLLFEFDESDRVIDHIVTFAGEKCQDSRICVRDRLILLLAPEEVDQHAKKFVISADVCNVYLFTSRSSVYRVSVIGKEDRYIVDDVYGSWSLEKGVHDFRVYTRSDIELSTAPAVDCRGGQVFIYKIEGNKISDVRFHELKMEKAKTEIGRRRLFGELLLDSHSGRTRTISGL